VGDVQIDDPPACNQTSGGREREKFIEYMPSNDTILDEVWRSRHRIILGMGVALSAAAAFTALSGGIWLAILGASLIGLATGVFYIAANPLVSELYPENVGLAVGLRGMSSQLAAVAAPFLVGLAIVLGTWRIAFGALSVLAMVAVVAFGVAVRRAELPRAGAADRDLLGGIRAQWPLVLAGIGLTTHSRSDRTPE